MTASREIVYKGVLTCVALLAKQHGLSANRLNERLKRGIPLEEALANKSRIGGVPRSEVRLRAEKMGIKPDTAMHRIVRGWPLEKAVSTPVRGYDAYPVFSPRSSVE